MRQGTRPSALLGEVYVSRGLAVIAVRIWKPWAFWFDFDILIVQWPIRLEIKPQATKLIDDTVRGFSSCTWLFFSLQHNNIPEIILVFMVFQFNTHTETVIWFSWDHRLHTVLKLNVVSVAWSNW